MKLIHSNTPFQFMLHLYCLSECLGQVTLYFFYLSGFILKGHGCQVSQVGKTRIHCSQKVKLNICFLKMR